MIIGRQFVENQYEDEKLYSTGNDELDEMLEKAFCEGYEYAQKEFARAIPTQKVVQELKRRGSKDYLLDSVGQITKVARDRSGQVRIGTAEYDRRAIDSAIKRLNHPVENVHDNINLRSEIKNKIEKGGASLGDYVATKGGKQYSHLRMNTQGFLNELKGKAK